MLKTKLLILLITTFNIAIAQTDAFSKVKLAKTRLDSIRLTKIDGDIKNGFYGKVTSVLVYHDSSLVFEKYYNGT